MCQNTLKQNFDVVVIGGGPAGTSTAFWLAKLGITVALIERSNYQGFQAGETVHPSFKILLKDMGVWERFCSEQHLPSYGNLSSWGNEFLHESHFLFSPYGTGWHLRS